MTIENDDNSVEQFLAFMIGNETFAIDVASVKEVLVVPKITRVPRMPAYLEGVINLRGNVIPVLDLSLKFGIGATKLSDETSIIVTEMPSFFNDGEDETITVGIFSDGVEQVVEMSRSSIQPPPQIGMAISSDFILGVGKHREDFVIILNLGKLLTERELMHASATMEAAHG